MSYYDDFDIMERDDAVAVTSATSTDFDYNIDYAFETNSQGHLKTRESKYTLYH